MQYKPGIFSDMKMMNLIHRFLFSILVLLCVFPIAYGAGYTCPAYKKYTSCNSGYYLNGTAAGNSCATCPSGCTCAGGTAQPVCNCEPGYYKSNGNCVQCSSTFDDGYYCPGDNNRYKCPWPDVDYNALSGGIWQDETKRPWANLTATNANQCIGDIYIKMPGGQYLAECRWNGENYFDSCNGDYLWYLALPGYYLTGYKNSSWEDWYSGVKPCTNAPANSNYTGAGDPETNNCPWICNTGYYKSGDSCVLCEYGYICPGDNIRHTCPIDPITGSPGSCERDRVQSEYGCWHTVAADAGVDIGRNEYTTATAHCYWNGKNYALGGNNIYGCDAYHIVACSAGYYAPTPDYVYGSDCIPVETGYYSAEGLIEKSECTNKPANSHYVGTGASSANCPWECDAGYNKTLNNTCAPVCDAGIATLRVGSVSIPLYKSRNTTPSLNIGYNGRVCYGNLAEGTANGKINLNFNGTTYHVID